MSRLNESLPARNDEGPRYYTVYRPTAHEGLGRALRNAFRQPENHLPPELVDLIGKLNRIPL